MNSIAVKESTMDWKAHSAAGIFPMMDTEAFEQLKTDIAEHGQREPIIIHDGLVLDGRNRLKACQELGVEPDYKRFEGSESDVVDYVVSLNLRRRHLNASQRAMVAATVANFTKADAGAQGGSNRKFAVASKKTTQQAADMMNVSERAVSTAKKIAKEGEPEVIEAVQSGDMSLNEASNIIQLHPEQQKEVAALPKEQRRELTIDELRGSVQPSSERSKEISNMIFALKILNDIKTPPSELLESVPAYSARRLNEEYGGAILFVDALKVTYSKWSFRNAY
ncbi:MAG: ParB/RepB/Spo0J family partition protein [Cohaesibacter sp.]|jgi:predicted HTH domain antitoxin|nr:ParB/RepB/Spo0J family partition protein [Cohaesibacter sp.]